jgi:predicted dehydrogenase
MPLRIAIIGCGKIADAHVAQIGRIPGCKIVGACDREELMVRQLADRFQIDAEFTDADELLRRAKPDVVHITTPPRSHYPLARRCLEAGCHVYVEKPVTLHAAEAEELVAIAMRCQRQLTVGHDAQFSHAALLLRRLIDANTLGGPPVHMESHYGYDLGGVFGNALLGDKQHWVRSLPGKLLQNVISHGIAHISEHLVGDSVDVMARGFISPELERAGEDEIVDELRVLICDRNATTAYFTFSSRIRPHMHQFRIYGPKQGLILDEDQQTVIRLRGTRHKSFAHHFASPVQLAQQYLGNVLRNAGLFLRSDFHVDSGKKHLIERFYASLTGGPPPIPYREIVLSARIMDAIFAQVHDIPTGKAPEPAAMLGNR